MPMISENWAEQLEPGLRKIFDLAGKKEKDYLGLMYNVENSTKAQETNQGIGDLGLMEEWGATGNKVAYEDIKKGYTSNYIHRKYSKGTQIERELVDDEQYGEIKKRVKNLRMVEYRTIQYHAASVFNNAFNASYKGPDNVALCSASHPKAPNSSAVTSNFGAYALTQENVTTVRNNMRRWEDDKANQFLVMPDTIVVPTEGLEPALVIAGTDEKPGTTDHGINVWKGKFNVIEWPWLTDPDAWFMMDSERAKMFLNWFWRRKPGFKATEDFDTEIAKYATIARFSYGWDDFSFIYGCKPA